MECMQVAGGYRTAGGNRDLALTRHLDRERFVRPVPANGEISSPDDGPAFPHMGDKPMEPRSSFDPDTVPRWPDHMENFLQCVRTGEQPRCHIDEAFIEVVSYLMSVVSYREQRLVRWDAANELIV